MSNEFDILAVSGVKVDVVGDGHGDLANDVTIIIKAVIGVLGLACVVVMIIGGVNYMTSSGDTGKVKKAKDTILYGLIGLVVCALAFAIVNWVIGGVLGGSSGSDNDGSGIIPAKQCSLDGGIWYDDGNGGGWCENPE